MNPVIKHVKMEMFLKIEMRKLKADLIVSSNEVTKILLPVKGEKKADDATRLHLISLNFDLMLAILRVSHVATDLSKNNKLDHGCRISSSYL